jgi:hypothetical protein
MDHAQIGSGAVLTRRLGQGQTARPLSRAVFIFAFKEQLTNWTLLDALRCMRLPSNHGVRFPDGATLVAGSIQTFIGDFRPKLFQRRRCSFVRMLFGIVVSPRHGSVLLSAINP